MKNKILLLPFPFDDFSAVKMRPALCLTKPISFYNHIVVAFISSNIPATTDILNTDIVIKTSDLFFAQTGLKCDSVIRLHKLITIPQKIVQRNLGTIPAELEIVINEKLKTFLELP